MKKNPLIFVDLTNDPFDMAWRSKYAMMCERFIGTKKEWAERKESYGRVYKLHELLFKLGIWT